MLHLAYNSPAVAGVFAGESTEGRMQDLGEDHEFHKAVWERTMARFLPSWYNFLRKGVIAVQID